MSQKEYVVARTDDLENGEMITAEAADTVLLLSRVDDEFYACAAYCTHYGAPLADGVLHGHRVRCPWHQAAFDVRSGQLEDPPALDELPTFDVRVEGDKVKVSLPEDPDERRTPEMSGHDPSKDDRTFIILGAGAAGEAAAETLRAEGFAGKLILVSKENELPYDRPNLSKDYLGGEAKPEWMPLRGEDFYESHDIELRLGREIRQVDAAVRAVRLDNDEVLTGDALLLATGGLARTPNLPGSHLDNIFTLRSFSDSDRLIKAAEEHDKAVIVGASFIGLEAASSLAKRGVKVTVVAPEEVPFARVFGEQIGRWVQSFHEEKGVEFKLGRGVKQFHGDQGVDKVELDDKDVIDTDFVLIGIGVKPATSFINGVNKGEDGSILVSEHLLAAEGVYAAGDIARYPDPRTHESIRIEHWRLAQQHGRIAAHNMLGKEIPFKSVPFFWTRQHQYGLQYIGHVKDWDEVYIDGEVNEGDFTAYYARDGKVLAAASAGRSRELGILNELMAMDALPPLEEIQTGTFKPAEAL